MNHKGPRGENGIITYLAEHQKKHKELYSSVKGIVTINEEHVHIMGYLFTDLFHDSEVTKKTIEDNDFPYRYKADKHGVTFMAMSREPLEFKKYPIEELAWDLLHEWQAKGSEMDKYGLAYHDGSYQIVLTKLIVEGQQGLLESHDLYHIPNSAHETIEQAILDFEEAMQNESTN